LYHLSLERPALKVAAMGDSSDDDDWWATPQPAPLVSAVPLPPPSPRAVDVGKQPPDTCGGAAAGVVRPHHRVATDELARLGHVALATQLDTAVHAALVRGRVVQAETAAETVAAACWKRNREHPDGWSESVGWRAAFVVAETIVALCRAHAEDIPEAVKRLDLAIVMGGPSQELRDLIAQLPLPLSPPPPPPPPPPSPPSTTTTTTTTTTVVSSPPSSSSSHVSSATAAAAAAVLRSINDASTRLSGLAPESLPSTHRGGSTEDSTSSSAAMHTVQTLHMPGGSADSDALHATRTFRDECFVPRKCAVITGLQDRWSAGESWSNLPNLVALHGHRWVPIEVGVWPALEERFVSVREFFEVYFAPPRESELEGDAEKVVPPAYLAQHNLFEQIPELAEGFVQPPLINGTSPQVHRIGVGESGGHVGGGGGGVLVVASQWS
jgi:hypothetical protein